MARIFITNQDIAKMKGIPYAKAYRYYQVLKDMLGKEKHQRLTVWDYAKCEDMSVEEVRNFINSSCKH